MHWLNQNADALNAVAALITAILTIVLTGFGTTAVLVYLHDKKNERAKRVRMAVSLVRQVPELLELANAIDAGSLDDGGPRRSSQIEMFESELDRVIVDLGRLWDDSAITDYEAAAFLQIALAKGRETRRIAAQLRQLDPQAISAVGQQLLIEEPLSKMISAISAAQARIAQEKEHDYLRHYRNALSLIDHQPDYLPPFDEEIANARTVLKAHQATRVEGDRQLPAQYDHAQKS